MRAPAAWAPSFLLKPWLPSCGKRASRRLLWRRCRLAQVPLGAPRAHLLQPLAAQVGARAGTVAHSAREVLAVRGPWSVVRGPWSVVRGQVDDPPVYAQRSTGGVVLRRSWATLGDAV